MAAKRDLPVARLLGERLRLLREARNLSQATLAERTGFTQQQISQVERGLIDTPIETWAKIAEGLGVSMRECLPDDCALEIVDQPPIPNALMEIARDNYVRLGYSLGFRPAHLSPPHSETNHYGSPFLRVPVFA